MSRQAKRPIRKKPAKRAPSKAAGKGSPSAKARPARAATSKRASPSANGERRARQKPKPRKSPVSKAERRLQILDASRDVFAKRGYARATVDDIVAEAGVARGTFYLYFDDKREAFAELIDRFAMQITGVIVRIATDQPDRSVAEQVLENIRAILRLCLVERSMTKILFTDAVGVDPEFERKLTTFYDTVVQLLTESLRDGQQLGIVADGEPRVMAYLTVGALKELLYQAVTLGLAEESAEALTQQMYAFLSQGYLRAAGGQKSRRGRRTATR